eukprot:CAMPEP_0201618590 /NCGR_PEP_ID=MMETSP0492-20130828/39369_1 /ASSEMBLY_ACC=CAM_ASM_000837 /TAXON_ID=420259 /ORGANISM="Thalassiosira gravida, Strain GMp14c1" /LENGTH=38 /DNA_ID= /DNA_START= /DNA_END= /DNA_ORIENTATION=
MAVSVIIVFSQDVCEIMKCERDAQRNYDQMRKKVLVKA